MKELVEHLESLQETCHQVLAVLDPERDDRIAQAIRETCREVDERLAELDAS
jgi:DNA-binding ferritin-like protein